MGCDSPVFHLYGTKDVFNVVGVNLLHLSVKTYCGRPCWRISCMNKKSAVVIMWIAWTANSTGYLVR